MTPRELTVTLYGSTQELEQALDNLKNGQFVTFKLDSDDLPFGELTLVVDADNESGLGLIADTVVN